MLVRFSCTWCKRSMHYLAADLAPLFHQDAVIGQLWGYCPRCGKSDYWREEERYANSSDVGHTVIRRPAGIRKVQLWRNEYYGPPVYGPPWPPPREWQEREGDL